MSDFERERDRLIGEISEASGPCRVSIGIQTDQGTPQNLAKCVTSVNQLNRNIESVTIVGAGFEPVHHLWKQFETVMGASSVVRPDDVILCATCALAETLPTRRRLQCVVDVPGA